MHILCTICSDLVNQAENIFATKCGHIFHYHCLSQWIERSKSCPQCRNKVTDKCMFRIYPTISNETSGEDITTLQSRLDDAQLQLRQQKTSVKEKDDKLASISGELNKKEELLKAMEKKLVSKDSAVSALKEQLEYVKIQNMETNRLKEENESLKKNLQMLNGLQKVLNATSEEVEQMLEGYTDVRTVATFATALKRALCESESKKNDTRDKLQAAKQQIGIEKKNVADLQAGILQLEERLQAMKQKRKAYDMMVDDEDEQCKRMMLAVKPQTSPGLNKALLIDERNSSFNTQVKKIETSDSPYLCLKQSSLALTALQQRPSQLPPDSKLKPSELALVNAAKNATKRSGIENIPVAPLSIFHRKEPARMDLTQKDDLNITQFNISYDGLGGHSKLDTFPKPNNRPLKSCVPKLTAKHKLKRPTPPAGSQDISKLLDKISNK